MLDQGMIQVSYRRLREIVSGLQVLKERRLPSLDAELRVAKQMRKLLPYLEIYQELRNKEVSLHQASLKDSEPVDLIALQNKILELDNMLVDIPEPRKKFTQADLPQAYAGEAGQMNTLGNAGAVVALAPEFFDLPDDGVK